MQKGKFIVLEGIDGSGKSTQAKLLVKHLETNFKNVELHTEPTKGKYGLKIRQHLRNDDISNKEIQKLFIKDRKEHASEIIKKLKKGIVVVSDRYTLSTIAYGSISSDLDIEKLKRMNKQFPAPDLTIILDIAPEEALLRINKDESNRKKEMFDNLKKLRKIRDAYYSLKNYYPNTEIINGIETKEKCAFNIERLVYNHLFS